MIISFLQVIPQWSSTFKIQPECEKIYERRSLTWQRIGKWDALGLWSPYNFRLLPQILTISFWLWRPRWGESADNCYKASRSTIWRNAKQYFIIQHVILNVAPCTIALPYGQDQWSLLPSRRSIYYFLFSSRWEGAGAENRELIKTLLCVMLVSRK